MSLTERPLGERIFRNLEDRAWFKRCSPQAIYLLAIVPIPWLSLAATIACLAGVYLGFFVAPLDEEQREVARIAFIHLPASWVATLVYLLAAAMALVGWLGKSHLAAMLAHALAPTGLLFAFLGLWTGSLWGKPIWGDWWVWNLRTYLELALALLYFGFIAVHMVLEDIQRADKVGAVLLLVGVFCVAGNWLAVQPATAAHLGKLPGNAELASLAAMSLGFLLYSAIATLLRLRCVILERERQNAWVLEFRRRT